MNQAKIRYTDTAYVIHQQWLMGGELATFPIVHQYLQQRLADQQKLKADEDQARCRCLKSEPLLSERKQRRRKSRSLERQRSRRGVTGAVANGDVVDGATIVDDSTTDEDESTRAGASGQQTSAVVAEVYHRMDSSLIADDEVTPIGSIAVRRSVSLDNGKSTENDEDCNRNRFEVPDRNLGNIRRTSSPVVLRRPFFEPISESSTSCDEESANSEYATVQYRNQVNTIC